MRIIGTVNKKTTHYITNYKRKFLFQQFKTMNKNDSNKDLNIQYVLVGICVCS